MVALLIIFEQPFSFCDFFLHKIFQSIFFRLVVNLGPKYFFSLKNVYFNAKAQYNRQDIFPYIENNAHRNDTHQGATYIIIQKSDKKRHIGDKTTKKSAESCSLQHCALSVAVGIINLYWHPILISEPLSLSPPTTPSRIGGT